MVSLLVGKCPMRLPKFWKDSGHWNDAVVSLCILLSLLAWLVVAWHFGSYLFALAAVVLAPLFGFGVGVIVVHVLCTYFNAGE